MNKAEDEEEYLSGGTGGDTLTAIGAHIHGNNTVARDCP